MPIIKRRFQIQRRDWPRDHQIQAAFGTDDFNNAWGSHLFGELVFDCGLMPQEALSEMDADHERKRNAYS